MSIPAICESLGNGPKNVVGIKGFSERNLKRMLAFYRLYSWLEIVPRPVAQLAEGGKIPIAPCLAAEAPEQWLIEGFQRLVLVIRGCSTKVPGFPGL